MSLADVKRGVYQGGTTAMTSSVVSEKEKPVPQALTPDVAPVRQSASLLETMAVASGIAHQQQREQHEFKEKAPSPKSAKHSACVYSELDFIAEALPSELVVTSAYDPKHKFIAASYGSDSPIIVGGYEGINKIAFVVNFASVEQIEHYGCQVQHHLSTLVKKPIKNPIQLHVRGDYKGKIQRAIEAWMQEWAKLPMKIASLNESKSLSINAQTGEVNEYDPLSNSHARERVKDALEESPDSVPELVPAYITDRDSIPSDAHPWWQQLASNAYSSVFG
jgi:hypothetical protein